jgi:hypothetical protein
MPSSVNSDFFDLAAQGGAVKAVELAGGHHLLGQGKVGLPVAADGLCGAGPVVYERRQVLPEIRALRQRFVEP